MVSWMNSWAQGIIVAVIIATIIELILPNGNSKKYVKVVLGIYILFTIISPVISKLTNEDISITEILDTQEYEEVIAKSDDNISKKIESNNNRTIKDIYIANLEADIKSKLKEKGYDAYGMSIKVKEDDNYTIEKISLSIIKRNEQTRDRTNSENIIVIENVNIQIENEEKSESTNIYENDVVASEKNEIKEYLSKTYDIDPKSIEIS